LYSVVATMFKVN